MTPYIIIGLLLWVIVAQFYVNNFDPILNKPKIWEIVLIMPVFLLFGIVITIQTMMEIVYYFFKRKGD